MNKRIRKKISKDLSIAVRELNNDIAVSEGFELISDAEVVEIVEKLKKSKNSINQTLGAYKNLSN